MIDYMIWPWLDRIEFLEFSKKIELEPAKFPKIRQYIQNMNELQVVKDLHIPAEQVGKFLKTMASGEPDYDLGI